MQATLQPSVEAFFHEPTSTYSYVVADPSSQAAAVIDPVLDYDSSSGRTSTRSAQRIVDFVREAGLRVEWILETHAHADHLSAAQFLKAELDAPIGIGAGIRRVQATFKEIFNLASAFSADGSQFDRLFEEHERFSIGDLEARVIATPGHTNDSISYVVGDSVFIGDTMFSPDYGTARADFPGGDAGKLYRSIRQLLAMPEATKLYLCHDYPPDDRAPRCMTTVGEQKRANVHVHDGVAEDEFVRMREQRDATLAMPKLIIPSIQVNIRAGAMPEPECNGVSYLKVPVDVLGRAEEGGGD